MSVSAQWQQGSGATAALINTEYAAFEVDSAVQTGGAGKAPTPHDLLNSALAACTVLTLQVYCQRKTYPLESVHVVVKHSTEEGRHRLSRAISLQGELSCVQRTDMLRVANACPIHKVLQSQLEITTDIT